MDNETVQSAVVEVVAHFCYYCMCNCSLLSSDVCVCVNSRLLAESFHSALQMLFLSKAVCLMSFCQPPTFTFTSLCTCYFSFSLSIVLSLTAVLSGHRLLLPTALLSTIWYNVFGGTLNPTLLYHMVLLPTALPSQTLTFFKFLMLISFQF